MARINVGVNCVMQAEFVLRNRILSDAQCVVFKARLATDHGTVLLEHAMHASEPTSATDTRARLCCDLRGMDVLPGIYSWELLLQDEDGSLHCLLPAADNVLCVYATATGSETEVQD